jgi:hypothetical protein
VPLAVVAAPYRSGKGLDHLSGLRRLDLNNSHFQPDWTFTREPDGKRRRLEGLRFQREIQDMALCKPFELVVNCGNPGLDPIEKPMPPPPHARLSAEAGRVETELDGYVAKGSHLLGHLALLITLDLNKARWYLSCTISAAIGESPLCAETAQVKEVT